MTLCIDSHAHLTSDSCFEDIEGIIARAQEAGIGAVINVCTDKVTIERGQKLKTVLPVYNTMAVHPHDVAKEEIFPLVAEYAAAKKLIAIGETGLDYHYSFSSKEKQRELLLKQLQLAQTHDLPVIIHCREAFQDFFRLFDENTPSLKGVLHCFTGTMEEMQAGLERGFYISLSGIVTFPKSSALQEVAKKIPLERLLVETDAPYLAPQKKRGKRNEPAYLVETVRFLADFLEMPFEKLARSTAQNTEALFKL